MNLNIFDCIPLTIFMCCVLCGLMTNIIFIIRELSSDDKNKNEKTINRLLTMLCGFICCTLPCYFIISRLLC